MKKTITRSYCFDGDICDVIFRLYESCGKYIGEYPDFEEEPRYTPHGRMWITAMQTACRHSQNKYSEAMTCEDCGSCVYFAKQQQGDLIGVCEHKANRRSIIISKAHSEIRKERKL